MIKAIIFDFDGTLVDTIKTSVKCTNLLANEYNYEPIHDIEKIRHQSMKEIVKNDLKLNFFTLHGYIQKMKKLLHEHMKEVKFFKGIKNVIRELKKNYKIGILTTNTCDTVNYLLNKHNIKIDFIFTDSSIFGKHKMIKKLMKRYNLKKNELVYVGDELRDIEACRKAGIKIISVSQGYNLKKSLSKMKPDYIIDNPEDLLKLRLNQ